MVPPPSQSIVAVCNQITLLILYYISSKMATFLKVTDAPIQVPNVFDLTVSFQLLNFRYSFFLFLKCLPASCLTMFRLYTYLCFGSCIHCILACFLWSKKPKHSSSNHGFCCFNSYRTKTLFSWSFDNLFNVLPSPIYVLVIAHVLQSCKPVCNLNLITVS